MSPAQVLDRVLDSPIDFYGVGKIIRQDSGALAENRSQDLIFSYDLLGAEGGSLHLLFFFDSTIDSSLCAEIGNVISSRCASRLGCWTTPPRAVSEASRARLQSGPAPVYTGACTHEHEGGKTGFSIAVYRAGGDPHRV